MSAALKIVATPAVTEIELSAVSLELALRASLPFVSNDETRFHLASVALAVDGGRLAFVATNGHYLGRAIPAGVKMEGPDRVLCLIPASEASALHKRVKLAIKSTAPCRLTIDGLQIGYRNGTDTYACRAIDSTFPAYQAVIPALRKSGDATVRLGFNPRYFVDAMKACAGFIGRSGEGVAIQIPASELDPVRFDAAIPKVGEMTVVVMPMRLK